MRKLHLLIRRIKTAWVRKNKTPAVIYYVLFCKDDINIDDDDGGFINEAFDDQMQNMGKYLILT